MGHPMIAVLDMIRRSSVVAKEQNKEDRENMRHRFALGDMSEPEFFRAMRHLGADDHEIAEFVQFTRGDE
jgi:hypothetical protein